MRLRLGTGCSLPQPLAAGGGDVVVAAAGVDRRLDFSLTALRDRQRGSFWCRSRISRMRRSRQLQRRINRTLGSLWKATVISFRPVYLAAAACWWKRLTEKWFQAECLTTWQKQNRTPLALLSPVLFCVFSVICTDCVQVLYNQWIRTVNNAVRSSTTSCFDY